ncbi:putative DNA-directed DNA polymerase [Dioscorea sansibarensis]
MEETAASGRRTRNRGPEAKARAEALERLKAIRGGARRSDPSGAAAGYQIKMESPIYDTVAEEEYAALVARRREETRDFIVDDDGLGYIDEGQEEDWSHPSHSFSSDEEYPPSDDGLEKPRKKRNPKKEPAPKKPQPSSLSAAAALMGKQRLSSMFTSSVFKKNERTKGTGLSSDSIVDDVLAEFAPDENDREEWRRRGSISRMIHGPRGSFTPVQNSNELPLSPANQMNAIDSSDAKLEIVSVKSGLLETDISDHGKDDPMELVKDEEVKDVNEEIEVEASKRENGLSVNAKVKVEGDDIMLRTSAGCEATCNDANVGLGGVNLANASIDDDKTELVLDSDGSLPFYIIDAHEESFGANAGTLYLFGKVKEGNAYQSCCVVVKNMQRCIYAVPNRGVFPGSKIMEFEENIANSKASPSDFHTALQEMAAGLKSELTNRLLALNVSNFSMMPVKRNYAFERADIPRGEQYVLKINYPFKDPPLPTDLKGEHFLALLGTNSSALELFLIKRKIKGPSWLWISRFACCPASQRVSWCKYEVMVDCPKDLHVSASKAALEIPPVVVAAINVKTIIGEKHTTNEIVSASIICCHKAKIDSPIPAKELERPGMLSSFTVVRKLGGGIFPMGLEKEAASRNSKAGSNVLAHESSERALLNRLMIELHKLDCDVLVGHNISGFDLDILLHRAQVCKVPSAMWSKIGRLKRSVMPKLTKGNSLYGSGASPGIMSCIAGRLLCDTYVCSRDLLREVSYSLTQLAKTQLKKDRKEIAPHDIPAMFQMLSTLLELVDYGENDARLSLELMFHLSVLPLTRQLTNISGNLWGKTLQGARAQRVEYLLLHSFHAKKYMVPDKNSGRGKEMNTTKRRISAGAEGDDNDNLNVDSMPQEDGDIEQGKGKKGPAYSGGLVLEPKKGLHDKYVLLLDFNSLYPSIIREFNICFTTVERSTDGAGTNLPSLIPVGVLPELLKNLVERRKMVKSWLKNASGLKAQQLDIQQQALKLTANSMYGCLGFSNSRFYAKPLAELITLKGREILQSTVDVVQNHLNFEVIYGDTDSIMIYTGLDDINKAKTIAGKVIQEVNKKYGCLEIDLDGLYKRMLLLKKKKYAAVKVQFKNGIPYEVIERKGVDMVRRDWSDLSRDMGNFCLNQILSERSCEDVVESIHSSLMKVQEQMRNGEIDLEKYVIWKTLTKPPEDYPDAKNQPHVQVALRLKQNGYSGGSAGDTVPYVICCQQESTSGSSAGIAQRARHPDELKRDGGSWLIDINYYLSQQIHPVVSRLCASIQGTSPARLADCLGLDSSKYQYNAAESAGKGPTVLLSVLDDGERYSGCMPLRLSCPCCSSSFDCPPISSLLSTSSNRNQSETQSANEPPNFWCTMRCSRCPGDVDCRVSPAMIANQVKRQADDFTSLYYRGSMMCDDELCKHTTRSVNLRVIGDAERGTVCPKYPRCNGHLIRQYTEADLYKQLSYFCYVLDSKRFLEKLELKDRTPFEKDLAVIRPAVELASSVIHKIRDRCAYGWVSLGDLSVSLV